MGPITIATILRGVEAAVLDATIAIPLDSPDQAFLQNFGRLVGHLADLWERHYRLPVRRRDGTAGRS